jgi:hypothetical protein
VFLLTRKLPFVALIAGIALTGADAQDLDAGKTGAQLFAQDCSACHRTPQALVKGPFSFSLTGFLRQHYTTSSRSAAEIAAYLNSVGASRAAATGSETRKSRKQSERTAAGRAADQPGVDGARGRKERRSPPPAGTSDAVGQRDSAQLGSTTVSRPEPAAPTAAQENVSTAAIEPLMPPPVEPAEPLGLEPGAQAFSSPVP